jgi:uncharacterized protein YbaP (TraB family)
MRRPSLATLSLALMIAVPVAALVACKSEPARRDKAADGDDPWASTEATGGKATVIARPFLWKAEKDGVTTWLFGTMHLGVNAETQLPGWVFDKLTASKTFAMEADTSDPSLAMALQRSDGGSLREDLGPEHWKKLEDEIGANLAKGMDGMKPFAAMTVLVARDLPMTPPMDAVMAERARDAKIPIHYLEQGVDQIAMIDPWMAPGDIKALLDNRDFARTFTRKMLDTYRSGDAATMGSMFDDQTLWLAAGRSPATFPAYLDAVLGKRNRAWIPQLEKLHAEGGAFVAVGAGHLTGPGNVIDLLAQRGFTITRVTAP